MKKIYSILFLLPLLFSCTREKAIEEEAPLRTIRFEAGISETKTYLGDKTGTSYPNYWAAGDAISVNGVASDPLEDNSSYIGTKKAEFSVTLTEANSYHFAYPAAAVSSYNNGSAVITLPATQHMVPDYYDPSAFVMVGSSSVNHVDFSPVMSVIKLTIPGTYDAKVSYVMFESLGSEKVSGPFNTDYAGITAASGAKPRVQVYAYGEGMTFGNSMYLLIPAQTYASGMRFTIRATDGTQMVFSTSSSFTAQAGAVYPLTTQNYTPAPEVIPEGLMVMSSNVRFASARDKSSGADTGDRDWTNRKVAYYAMVNNYSPAVIGLQEAEKEQVNDILNNCSGYGYYGLGRKNGNDITSNGSLWGLIGGTQSSEESTTILYRTDLITLGDHGTFWHSTTPSTAGSYYSEMKDHVPQTTTWAILTYKPTNTQFFMLNTHLSLYDSRPKEITQILNTIASKNTNNLPVIMTGDWNLVEGDSWLDPIEAAYSNARHTAQISDSYGTYHWWGTQSKLIDHIYYKGIGDCYLFRTDARKWNDMYISDHYPVFAVFDIASSTITVPIAEFGIPDEIRIDEAVTFNDLSSSPAGIAYWEWDFDGIRSNEQNPTVTFRTIKSDVPVRLTVVDNNGNKASVTKFVLVNSSTDHEITEVWRQGYDSSDGATAYWTSPAVNAAGNKIYVSSSGYHLVGFDASGNQFGSYDIGKYGAYISGGLNCQTPTPSIDLEGNVYIPAQYSTGGSGSGGLFCLKGDLSAENWYVNTGINSQYRCCIPAIFGSYVSVMLTNVDTALFDYNMLILNRYDGSLKQTLSCDKGSFGGIAVSADGTLVFGAARGGSDGGKNSGTESGAGFKVGVIDGGFGSWKTSSNSDAGRSYNFLGLTHTDGYGYRTKGFQPAISTIDGSVYVAVTTDDDSIICARYNLNSYVYNSVPTPIWKVEVEAAANNFGFGCVLDGDGNAYVRAANKVFKLRASDGTKLWEYVTGNGNCGVPAIDNMGYVYVTDSGKQRIYKLSPDDGSLVSQIIISGYQPRTSPTIACDGSIYVTATSINDDGPYLFKLTCPRTTGPGSNWSQLGGNPQKTCLVPVFNSYSGSANHEGYNSESLY